MIKVLFLIHDLGAGGAEKVLVNLANHLDKDKFDVTVAALFGGGVNKQFLSRKVHYREVWHRSVPGNSKLMKLLTPGQLHSICVKEHYDVEIAYLEGPSTRIIAGCNDPDTKLVSWVHVEQLTRKCAAAAYRSYNESVNCYDRFDRIICVSNTVQQDFAALYPQIHITDILYNTVETETIIKLAAEPITDCELDNEEFNLIAVGKIEKQKGFERLAVIVKRLREEGFPVHLYALGNGSAKNEIINYLKRNGIEEYYTFLGYQINPYKYMEACDLFVCASRAEGFSTAATEALIVGTPVCTVEVSGMREMLGQNGEWGIVTENSDEALYQGIRRMIAEPELLLHYRQKALERGKSFSTEITVRAVEDMLEEVLRR